MARSVKGASGISPEDEFARQRNHLEGLLEDARLGEHAPKIAAAIRNSVSIRIRKARKADAELGASRLGGVPDIPSDLAGRLDPAMASGFVGQIRLEEVAPFDPLGKLPDAGLLSFFAAFAGSGDVGLVLFSPPGSHIVPLETGNARPSTDGIDFSPRVLLPPFASKVLDYYSREYEALYNPLFNDFGSIQHGMLGFDRPDEGLIEPEEQILLRLDQRHRGPGRRRL